MFSFTNNKSFPYQYANRHGFGQPQLQHQPNRLSISLSLEIVTFAGPHQATSNLVIAAADNRIYFTLLKYLGTGFAVCLFY